MGGSCCVVGCVGGGRCGAQHALAPLPSNSTHHRPTTLAPTPLLSSRTQKPDAHGLMATAVRPYLMDLGSTNGTCVNGEKLEPARYVELLEGDVIRFGLSSREYVLLHDRSAGA